MDPVERSLRERLGARKTADPAELDAIDRVLDNVFVPDPDPPFADEGDRVEVLQRGARERINSIIETARARDRAFVPITEHEPLPLVPAGQSAVQRPAHYNEGSIECIDAMKIALGDEGFKAYCHGAAFKYVWRAKYKNGDEDLAKAAWYTRMALGDDPRKA